MMHLFINALAASAGGGLTYIRNVVPRLGERPDVRATVLVPPALRAELGDWPRIEFLHAPALAGAARLARAAGVAADGPAQRGPSAACDRQLRALAFARAPGPAQPERALHFRRFSERPPPPRGLPPLARYPGEGGIGQRVDSAGRDHRSAQRGLCPRTARMDRQGRARHPPRLRSRGLYRRPVSPAPADAGQAGGGVGRPAAAVREPLQLLPELRDIDPGAALAARKAGAAQGAAGPDLPPPLRRQSRILPGRLGRRTGPRTGSCGERHRAGRSPLQSSAPRVPGL